LVIVPFIEEILRPGRSEAVDPAWCGGLDDPTAAVAGISVPMAARIPEERVRVPVLRQRWDCISFLHWRYDAAQIDPLLPPGVRAEEIDGAAWVGMTPFVARGTRLAAGPPLRLPDFPETNLRTYVRTRSGMAAVWFFSLEAASAAVVAAARSTLGVPYHHAEMEAEVGRERCRYLSRRRPGDVGHRVEVRPGPPLEGGEGTPLANALTGRWRAVVPRGSGRLYVPVRHEPWLLYSATLLDLEQSLTQAAGLPAPSGEPDVLWSPGVDAVLGLPRAG
jgi:uncharacterized protein YqjF (DUF2071 family)